MDVVASELVVLHHYQTVVSCIIADTDRGCTYVNRRFIDGITK